MRIVAGKYGSRSLKSPKNDATRPTQDKIKGAIFSSLGNMFDGGNFLDCYSGTGNMGLEAVSRGMDHATLVDNNKGAISVIKENVKSLKAEKETKIICGNIFSVLERLTLKYDVVYIDPPYAKQENEKLIQKLEDLDIVKSDGVIVVESLQEEVWPEKIASFIKYKEKTYGHLDIIERASKLFDQLVVFISPNSDKNNEFTEEKRLKWLNESTKHLSNVTCKIQSGLVVEACKSVNATVLVRGIRNGVDCTYEQNMAFMNARLNEDIETVCLFTRPEYSLYSSSNVRELFKYGQDISGFVPACVLEDLKKGEE